MEKLSGIMGKLPGLFLPLVGIFYSEASKGTRVCHDYYNLCVIV